MSYADFRKVSRLIFVLITLYWGESPLFPLNPQRRVTQYTLTTWQARDGLPQETITAIGQTKDGIIWIGAPSGLIRFDGTRFQRIPFPPDTSSGDHYITGLLADGKNGIWATTRNGLFYVRNNQFRHWGTEVGLPADGALGLAKLNNQTLALATSRGVMRFEPKSGKVYPPDTSGINPASALTVARGQSARIWAGTMRGLLQLKQTGMKQLTIRHSRRGEIVNAILEDSKKRLWIGTSLGIRLIPSGKGNTAAFHRLDNLWIRCMLEDQDHNVWIGTRGNGAYRFNGKNLARFSTKEGLPDDLVRQIFEDQNGSLWFVTAGGLARLRDGAVTSWTVREGLPVPFIWSVYADQSRHLWIGTSGGGIVRLENGTPTRPDFDDPGLAGVEIRSFLTGHKGDLWIGTGGNGLARVHGGKVYWYRWNQPIGRNTVYCLLQDRKNRLWVGTANGLACFEQGKVRRWFQHKDSHHPTVVRSLTEDSTGKIWVGTIAGLYWIYNGSLVAVPGTEKLSTSRIHCIFEEKDSVFWLATDAGLGRYENTKFQLIGKENGLPNNMLYWILSDKKGYFWISSDLGILRISRRELNELNRGKRKKIEVLVIGRIDGMPSTECNSGHPGGTKLNDGRFCFATTNGVAIVNPILVRKIETPPPVNIEAILLDEKNIAMPEQKGIAIEIPSATRRVEIQYGAISLIDSEKLSFRYQLIGFDPVWIDAGKAREAFFTNLPPGEFRFVVSARHGTGKWTNPPAELKLQVLPTVYQTPVFYIFVLAGIAFGLWGIFKIRTAHLRARERQLRQIVTQRTKDLKKVNEELASANTLLEKLAIRDALTGLANRRKLNETLEAECRRCFRQKSPLALLFIDIDHFKKFNDHYGHLAGDDCLFQVAQVMEKHARRSADLAARYGGEEFVLLLPEIEYSAASEIAESVRKTVAALKIPHILSPTAPVVTVSIGWICSVPEDETEPEHILETADKLLYEAKQNRNTVVGQAQNTEKHGEASEK